MKNLALLSLLLISPLAQAQDAAVSDIFAPKRVIKTNLAGYTVMSIGLNYEQVVGTKTTVGLLTAYKIPSVITVNAIGKIDGENQKYTGDIEPKGGFVNPYFRYYTKEALRGFYLEAFARYFSYSFLLPYDYQKNGGTIKANLDGTASAFGGGLGFGVQFSLAKRLFMDINSGFGVASGNAHIETNDPNLDRNDYLTIKRNIEKYQDDADVQVFMIGNILKDPVTRSDDRSAEADFKSKLFPIVRGGISIGYAF